MDRLSLRYAGNRVGQAALVLWAAFTASFILLNWLPGDALAIKFENPEAGMTPDQVQLMRDYYGADDPLIVSYFKTLFGFLAGNMGYSVETGDPVVNRLVAALPDTAKLATSAFVLAVVIGTAIAVAATYTRFSWLRQVLTALPSLFISVPTFWLGLVLIQIFSFRLGWFPVLGGAELESLVLPVVTLSLAISAPLAQVLIRSLDDAFSEPYVAVASAKGASRAWLLWRHVFRNGLMPVLTIAGLTLGELIAGSVITETVFGRNGIGRLTESAITNQDTPVLQGIVIIAATVFVTVNLIVDLLYPVLDPRVASASGRRE